MKYEIQKLDGRFTYRELFEYCIKFSNRMAVDQGPLHFNQVLEWFRDTYGWSAEIRDYSKMQKWTVQATTWMGPALQSAQITAAGLLREKPSHCNPHWSWTNGYDDLRIYVKGDAELTFFKLVHQPDLNS